MFTRKILNIAVSAITVASLILVGNVPVIAQSTSKNPPPPHLKPGKITKADRQAAANTNLQALQAAGPLAAAAPMAMAAAALPGGTPDYFGFVPNYANSPLPSNSTAGVVFSGGGGGSGAAASTTITNGVITGLTLNNGGAGYTSAPAVSFTGVGTGAAATANFAGTVTSLNLTAPGSGYASAPIVTISGDGTGATATAAVTGGVTGASITAPGTGYTSAPIVTISGDGSGATAHAAVTGGVSSIAVALGGSGYTTAAVAISGDGTGATADAVVDPIGIISGITLTNGGSGYTTATVAISGDGTGATADAVVTTDVVSGITITAPGSGYTNATVSIGGPGTGAVATAAVTTDVVSGFTLTSGGSGYSVASVSFSGPGTGAAASATITGSVTGLTLVNGGQGFLAGGIRKFVDTFANFCILGGPNDLGNCLSTAVPDTATYPNSDYYVIELGKYSQRFHSDLPFTQLEGYRQVNTTDPNASKFSYLGPSIIATSGHPVRIKFINSLGTNGAGDLFIPVDTTIMGAGMGPNGTDYSQNRATLHLHGGTTPWISDGTQHQWITPAGEVTSYPQGVSVKEVPDMAAAGCGSATDGCQTFYYTNQQSARLMFYHDHAYGITRLNVYAGQAAGYLLRDSTEAGMETAGVIPGLADNIPLIIQDKTFVPDNTQPFTNKVGTFASQLDAQDPTWDTVKYGGFGQLWMPHVYMPNQNPWDVSGANMMGRWDYGPWFWPPFTGITNGEVPNPLYDCGPGGACTMPWEPPFMPGTPNPSIVPEAFMDTPLVNGVAYPSLTVDPKAYRFRILNAANDRFWNLSLWTADPAVTTPDGRTNTEVKMVPFNSSQNLTSHFPLWWYTQGNPFTLDDRAGGVPDPSTRGPAMIQIGTEGGFLPAPAVILNQPVNYTYNRRDIVVLSVAEHALFLGPAERADVVVDFSQFAGKTLILYSDSPAPVPAGDPRNDYYTGDPDQTDTGGAPSTLPGYGPNTRTIMQIKVNGSGGTAPVDYVNPAILSGLQAALPVAYAASQPKPIVPQDVYNAAFGATYPANNYVRIQDNNMAFFNGALSGIQVINGGTGFTTPPLVNITGGGGAGATATASLIGAPVTGFTLTNGGSSYNSIPIVTVSAPPAGGTRATATVTLNKKVIASVVLINGGSGYLTPPTVTISGGGGSGATATAAIGVVNTGIKVALTNGGSNYTSAPTVSFSGGGGSGALAVAQGLNMALQPKAIQELFDPDYGRMNALLGVEIANTTGVNQTTIPYTDVDPATEIFKALPTSDAATPIGTGADGTQIWKITHNGVDTHAIHWHMFNVQIINRVGWDGAIRFPDANEIGWKDTVRMNPLEDVIVALRPITPTIPWDLPNSIRPLDVTSPIGSTLNFSNVDIAGHPAVVTNQLVNYGWEYVWHCHLLGHEENIMMRPIIFGVAPKTPLSLTAVYSVVSKKKGVNLTWTDNSLNETSWTIQRATSVAGPWTLVANVPSATGPTVGTVLTYRHTPVTTGTYFYRVIANNLVGFTQVYAPPAVGYPSLNMVSAPVISGGVAVP